MMSVPDPIKTSHLLTLLLEGPILFREKKKDSYPSANNKGLLTTTVPKIGTPLMGVIITVDNLVSNEASVRNLKLYDI